MRFPSRSSDSAADRRKVDLVVPRHIPGKKSRGDRRTSGDPSLPNGLSRRGLRKGHRFPLSRTVPASSQSFRTSIHGVMAGNRKRRIALVDDRRMIREWLSFLIAREEDLEMCGEAADLTQGISMIHEAVPDLAIVDRHSSFWFRHFPPLLALSSALSQDRAANTFLHEPIEVGLPFSRFGIRRAAHFAPGAAWDLFCDLARGCGRVRIHDSDPAFGPGRAEPHGAAAVAAV